MDNSQFSFDKFSNIHVMLDLETMGTDSDAAITQIGATVVWWPWIESWPQDLSVPVTVASQPASSVSIATMGWHIKTDMAATVEREATGLPIELALQALEDWLTALRTAHLHDLADSGDTKPRKICLWGNGAAFDQPILRYAIKNYAANPKFFDDAAPWYNDRCFRTMKNLQVVPEPPFMGAKHDALDDARHQAEWLRRIVYALELSAAPTA